MAGCWMAAGPGRGGQPLGGEAAAGAGAAAPGQRSRPGSPAPPAEPPDTTLIYLLSSLRDELSVPSKDDKNEIEKCLS